MKKTLKGLAVFCCKILKGLAVLHCGAGVIVCTSVFFSEQFPLNSKILLAALDCLLIFFLFLLLRPKKKLIENSNPLIFPSINTNLSPNQAIQSMKGSYTIVQAQNHLRILQDCLNIIEKTKNIETFFSRSEFGMQIAITLNQAQEAHIVPPTSDFPSVFFMAVTSQKERILVDSFWDQKEKIDKYATPKTKIAHWNRYLELLEKYSYQYDLEFQDQFQEVKEQVFSQISKLESVTYQ